MSSYNTRQAARDALGDQGYQSAFSSPGRPELWVKGRSRLAVARRIRGADEDWITLPYPEPATATCSQVQELAKRDGVVLSAGKQPAPEEVTLPAPADEDAEIKQPNLRKLMTEPSVLECTDAVDRAIESVVARSDARMAAAALAGAKLYEISQGLDPDADLL